nr:AMP-binding protein [Rhabdothermincola salaria]
MESDLEPTLPAVLVRRARETPNGLALRKKQLGRWKSYTWRGYAERTAVAAAGLEKLGVGPGDRVAVLSENRPAWVFVDLAVQALGGVTVGIYPTSPAAELEYLLDHSGATVLVAEDEEQVDKYLEIRDRLPGLTKVVVLSPRGVHAIAGDPALMTYAALEELGRGATVDDLEARADRVDPSATAIIVYTSGTTGPPKGAMLSHTNLTVAAAAAKAQFSVDARSEVLSYLPLCHVAERLISVMGALGAGYVVNFGEGGDAFAGELREVQPTFFLGVPRIWEKMMASVEIRMADASRIKRATYAFWTTRGARLAERRLAGKLGVGGRFVYGLGWLLLYRPLRKKLGLLRVTDALSGAAPISPEVLRFFWSLGVPVREGYGQTENTAQATLTPPDDVRIGTVGLPVPGSEIRIAEDGEILTRGPGTFQGYYRNPEATADTLDADGWLHTGDVGVLDADGHLSITDRKKDIIITAGGKNVSPSEIENRLKVSPYVREAIVIGDQRKYLTALIGIETDTVANWAQQHRIVFTTYEDLSSKPEVVELVRAWVDEVNLDLAQVETIKAFRLLPKELDQEDGEITATAKVKRKAIAEEFSNLIESMYGAGEA